MTPGVPLVELHGADPDLVGVLTELFAAYRSRRPTPTHVVDLDRDLWAQLEGLGLTRLTGSPERGGSGGTWADAAALIGIAAGAAAPVPLVERDVLAGWLLEAAGLPDDGGLRTVCRPDPSGVALNVTWAREVSHVVALWEDRDEWRVADVPRERVVLTERRNIAGEPCDTVEFEVDLLEAGVVVSDAVGEQFHLRGALARSAQVVGAMERVVELVLRHVAERTQFGRPIGRFQAVQHLVSDIASETALGRAATDAAVAGRRPRTGPTPACSSPSVSPSRAWDTGRRSSCAEPTRCSVRSARPSSTSCTP